jgi:hypothetical protein
MTPVQLTEKVIDLIADPKHWTQRAYSRDDRGYSHRNEACSYCSGGALRKLQDDFSSEGYLYGPTAKIVREAFRRKAAELFPNDNGAMTVFNDHHTHEEVMCVWNETLKDLRMAEDMAIASS